MGCKVSYNPNQTCCGQPSFNSGYWKETKTLAVKFLDDFEKAKKNIIQITDLRRTVREKRWELQKMNYHFHDDFMSFTINSTDNGEDIIQLPKSILCK